MRFGIILCFLTVLKGFCLAEEPGNSSITVTRADNQKPLPDAVVTMQPLSGQAGAKAIAGYTNAQGQFSFNLTEPLIVHITHLGFSTITDTLYQAGNKAYGISLSSQNIPEVVVTGQYGSSKPEKSVYEVKVIDGDLIRQKGANNLREALQNELHIDLQQNAIYGSSLSINGIGGQGVKIMVDGVPLVGRLDGKLDLSQVNIANVERIEVVEGPLSVMYGTDAMGGVINIITKSIQKEKMNISLRGYYETVGQYNTEANAGFTFKKNQLFISGGRNFFNGYTSRNLQRSKDWKPREQYFADARYIHTGSRYRVSLAASFFRELILNRSEPQRSLASGDTSWTYSGIDGHYLVYRPRVTGSFMYRFKEGYQLDALMAYTGFMRTSTTYYKDLVTGEEAVRNDPTTPNDTTYYHAVVFRSTYSMPAVKNRLNFQFGLDINHEFANLTNLQDRRQQTGDYAAFGGIRISIVEGLDIQPAIRFSYNTRFQVPLIPSVNVRYNYKKNLVLRASYGRGYRPPSLKELFLDFYNSDHDLKGNASLVPEDGHTFNASVNYTIPVKKAHRLSFYTGGFYNAISNKIDFVQTSAGPPIGFQYFNLKKYITYGAQETVTYEWHTLKLTAGILYTGYETSDTAKANVLAKFSSPDITAGASYRIPKAEIGINLMYKYNGAKPLFYVENGVQIGTRNPYHMLDLSLTRNFWKNRIQLTVGGKNLLGVRDVGGQNLPVAAIVHNTSPSSQNIGWGPTFFTSLVLQFSK